MSNQLLRTIIENMIGDYLEESYNDDVIDSIFEEVSEETWEAIEEAILSEISPDLRNRYASAAEKSLRKADNARMRSAPGGKALEKHQNTAQKRRKGLYSVGVRRDADAGNLNPQYMNKKDTEQRAKAISKVRNLKPYGK